MNAGLVGLGLAAGSRALPVIPRRLAWPAFAAVADLAARRPGRGTRRLAANLRRVVGPDLPEREFQALLRAAVRSYARYWLEFFRLPSYSRTQILAGFRIDNVEPLAAAVAAGRGAVLALPHAGNWDAAGAWGAAQGWPIVTVAERLRPESIYERFLDSRRRLGMEIVPLTGGDRSVTDLLAERLAAGHVVPLVADRDLADRGVEVEFFGGRARMPGGPALLALRTGAPLFVVSLWYEPDRGCARVEGPLPPPGPQVGGLAARVRALTQDIADRFAAGIAANPVDWHMMQRVWVDGPGTPGRPSGSGGPAGAPAGASGD